MLKIARTVRASALLLWLFTTLSAFAQSPDKLMSKEEFSALTGELSQKVSLFKDAWKENPQAEFFGGTSRDFIYWVKRQFIGVDTPEQAKKKIEELRSRAIIQPKEFLSMDSDVDIVSDRELALNKDIYGLTKIDYIKSERFNPSSAMGKSEIDQGYLPVEKIRIGSKGIIQNRTFGDGMDEIFHGRPTLHVTPKEVFETTHYAKQKANHQILLALRYLRTLSIDYYNSYGQNRPDPKNAFTFDHESETAAKKIIAQAKDELAPYFANPQFKKYFNDTVAKSFRSYINPTATYLLYKHFDMNNVLNRYEDAAPINQYLFATYRDPATVAENMKHYQTDPEKLYSPTSQEFPDGKLYHGTRTEEFFRSNLFSGVFPSEAGSAGSGLYSVRRDNLALAIRSAGTVDRVVEFEVKPTAKVIDVTRGEGARVFKEFLSRSNHQLKGFYEKLETGKDPYSEFAHAFDADILCYPYVSHAYVVKNSAVLSNPKGHTRNLIPLNELITLARKAATFEDLKQLNQAVRLNVSAPEEIREIWNNVPTIDNFIPFSVLENSFKDAHYIPDGLKEKLYSLMIDLQLLSEAPKPDRAEVTAFQKRFADAVQPLKLLSEHQRELALKNIAEGLLHLGSDRVQSIEPFLSKVMNDPALTKEQIALRLKTLRARLAMVALHGTVALVTRNEPQLMFQSQLAFLMGDALLAMVLSDPEDMKPAKDRLEKIKEEKQFNKLVNNLVNIVREERMKLQSPLRANCAPSLIARLKTLLR
ncbi:MAG: hypothetical protein ACJ763_03475 [Bdellovibrionia bacterium]